MLCPPQQNSLGDLCSQEKIELANQMRSFTLGTGSHATMDSGKTCSALFLSARNSG